MSGISFAQTMNSTGNWDDGTKWISGNIGDAITENVTLSGGVDPTVRTGFSYIIGNVTASGNDNDLTIAGTGSLTLGASGNTKSLSMTGANPKITVVGTLIIWGNASFNSKVVWNIQGTVIIKGNLDMPSGANLGVSATGTLQVEGNMSSGNNTDVNVAGGGVVQIFHDLSIGSGNLNGSGTFQFGGSCTAGGGSFCDPSHFNGSLPVELLYFKATSSAKEVNLNWATATEKNFDKFVIERSSDGNRFEFIGDLKGHHENSAIIRKYNFSDKSPTVGKNYYRLRSVDLDLTFEYSHVVFADFKGDKNISLYPNPLTGNVIHLTTNFNTEEGDKIEILNYLGTVIGVNTISKQGEEIAVENDLNPGVYVLRYTGKDYLSLTRFTKK